MQEARTTTDSLHQRIAELERKLAAQSQRLTEIEQRIEVLERGRVEHKEAA